MHNKKVQFDRQMIKVQLKHFQGHPFLKETGHSKMFRCYKIEFECLMPWNEKVQFDSDKYFQSDPFSKGIWQIVRCPCAMNMSLIYIFLALDWERHNVSQAKDDHVGIGQGHS